MMPDIFLSYSREDQTIARRFAQGFERAGLSVWWDVTLTPGDAYDQVTEKALQDAKAVVVLWSKRSVDSRWVRAEATQALDNKTLVPVMIGPCKRPIMFELTHTADLADWAGDAGDPLWQTFLSGLCRFIEAPAAGPVAAPRDIGVSQAPSIAVLPFLNISSDKEQEYFVDGLSEELLNHLAQVPKLRVIGRTSSFAFKGKQEDLRKIGELLGVNHILEGSVRKAGDSLRITAQLIDSTTGYHLWSETYDRKLENIFAIQDEIARAVTEKLRLTFSSTDRTKSGTQNVAAYEDFLVGISKLRTPQSAELLDSVRYLERATRLDPDFDDAWSALLDASFAVINIVPEQRVAAQQRADAIMARALEKAPASRAAAVAQGIRAVRAKDYATALDIRRELAASSNGGDSFVSYASLLLVLGRPRDAAAAYEEARRREPLDSTYTMMKMIAHDMSGQISEAKEEYRRALTMSNISLGRVERNALLMAMGLRDRETIDRVLPRAIEAAPDQAPVNGAALKFLDDAPAALRELHRLIDEPSLQGDVFSMSTLGLWAAYFGDEMLALEALRRTAQSNAAFESWGVTLWRPVMRPVRRLPGFKALLREHGVVDYWRKSGNWGEFCTPVGADDFECR